MVQDYKCHCFSCSTQREVDHNKETEHDKNMRIVRERGWAGKAVPLSEVEKVFGKLIKPDISDEK